jgi:hypothetical protein
VVTFNAAPTSIEVAVARDGKLVATQDFSPMYAPQELCGQTCQAGSLTMTLAP